MIYMKHENQYDLKVNTTNIVAGDGTVVFDITTPIRSDYAFLIENANRMMKLLLGIQCNPPGHEINAYSRQALYDFAGDALNAGIDIIGVTETDTWVHSKKEKLQL